MRPTTIDTGIVRGSSTRIYFRTLDDEKSKVLLEIPAVYAAEKTDQQINQEDSILLSCGGKDEAEVEFDDQFENPEFSHQE